MARSTEKLDKATRLAAALKANLKRRKAAQKPETPSPKTPGKTKPP